MPAYKEKDRNSWTVKFKHKNWSGETKWVTKRGFATKREALQYERDFLARQSGNLDNLIRSEVKSLPTYKDEKIGLWYCKFVYTDWTGTKKQKKKKGFRLQKETKQYEMDFLSKTSSSCDMRFSDMVEIYMEDCKARLRPTTYKGKEDVIAVHIMPYFKNLKVNEIQPMTIRHWQSELMSNQKNYKLTYLRTLNSQLSAIFNFAVKYYGLSSNPVKKSGAIGKKNSGLEQFWTMDEFKIFIEAVSDKLESKVIFNLLYWSGMRSGEMLALNLNDFDFEERTVSITKSYARVDGEDFFLDPKTPKSNRKITLPQFVCDMVKDYADRLYGYDPSDRLFEVTKHYLKSEMERGCKKTNLRLIRVHDLRHSHASLLIELGFAPLLISERLGHESVTTTLEIYSHLYPTKHGEVADRLESFA